MNVIKTVEANCQDCYRCVRACPVKAIAVTNGQAKIQDELCIHCGSCVRECPQHAKVVLNSTGYVKELLQNEAFVAASVAPSFAAKFYGWRAQRLPAALRRLGFSCVSETAEGAKIVSDHSSRHILQGSECVCTACPAVVNYVEKYRPGRIGNLISVVSPMIAHGKLIKKNKPGAKVVFVGPCAAKKQEALRPEYEGIIDAVLTFDELEKWLEEERIDLAACPESGFDAFIDSGDARLFPVVGGMLKTCKIACDGTQDDVLHLSGPEEVMAFFDMETESGIRIAEPLFCPGGCINGPAMSDHAPTDRDNTFTRRDCVIRYVKSALPSLPFPAQDEFDCTAHFTADEIPFTDEPDEAKIQQVLESTGKADPDLQLNCGACGYRSCRENAIAVARGMADAKMCMPYMRRLAAKRSDRIIETTPNGIVILDSELNMIHMNEAFMKMFMCNNGILGRRISYLVNADGFEKIAAGETELYESIKTKYGIKYHELLYALRDENQYVGIYVDISKIKFDSGQIDLVKRQTLEHAKELLNHQIRFSQEMAHFLGKNTGQSEELVHRIMQLYEEQDME